MLSEKTCTGCAVTKPVDEFWSNKRNPTGLEPKCRPCALEAKAASKARVRAGVSRGQLTDEEKFWRRVKKSDGCWEWTGHRTPQGYGTTGSGTMPLLAHRAAWVIENGQIEDGLCVCHSCDNPGCTRPSHLFLGTVGDNNADKTAKGRQAKRSTHGDYMRRGADHPAYGKPGLRGERSGAALLTAEQVLSIRAADLSAWGSASRLARELGVTPATICDILKRRSWTHI